MDTLIRSVSLKNEQKRRGSPEKCTVANRGKMWYNVSTRCASTERLDTKMGKISEADILKLSQNVYVERVTEHEIAFTEDFKRLVWAQKQAGKSMTQLFRESGIEPQVIGYKRIENLSRRLRDKARNHADLSDERKNNHRPEKKKEAQSLEEKVKYLEHELAYMRQEVEFLKKIQIANVEARKR